MTMHSSGLFFLLVVLFLAGSPSVFAEAVTREESGAAVGSAAAPVPVLLAEGWSISRWFSGSGGRTRVVQFCVATLCVALFIMMRKLR